MTTATLVACALLAAGCGASDGDLDVHAPGTSQPARLGPKADSSSLDAARSAVQQANRADGAVQKEVRAACVEQARAAPTAAARRAAVAACGRIGGR